MFMASRFKKKFILVTAAVFTFAFFKHDHEYTPNYELLSDGEAFASYNDGLVYIGNQEFLDNIQEVHEHDVLVLDERNKLDKNVKIYSSYKINDKDTRNDIICVICEYDNMYPSDWNRSIETMRLEWFVHNLLYNLHYQVDRTKDVDFTYDEEKTDDKKLIRKIFKV